MKRNQLLYRKVEIDGNKNNALSVCICKWTRCHSISLVLASAVREKRKLRVLDTEGEYEAEVDGGSGGRRATPVIIMDIENGYRWYVGG